MANEMNQNPSLQEIADKGAAIYDTLKNEYESKAKGKFLAIEVESRNVYLGDSTIEALQQARLAYPGKLFYVVKIGFDSVETLAHSLVSRS
jgi:hypothetical protein